MSTVSRVASQKRSLGTETHVGKAEKPKSRVTITATCRMFTRCSLMVFADNVSCTYLCNFPDTAGGACRVVGSTGIDVSHRRGYSPPRSRWTFSVVELLCPWFPGRELQLGTWKRGAKAPWWLEAILCHESPPCEALRPEGGHVILKSWLLGR